MCTVISNIVGRFLCHQVRRGFQLIRIVLNRLSENMDENTGSMVQAKQRCILPLHPVEYFDLTPCGIFWTRRFNPMLIQPRLQVGHNCLLELQSQLLIATELAPLSLQNWMPTHRYSQPEPCMTICHHWSCRGYGILPTSTIPCLIFLHRRMQKRLAPIMACSVPLRLGTSHLITTTTNIIIRPMYCNRIDTHRPFTMDLPVHALPVPGLSLFANR